MIHDSKKKKVLTSSSSILDLVSLVVSFVLDNFHERLRQKTTKHQYKLHAHKKMPHFSTIRDIDGYPTISNTSKHVYIQLYRTENRN